MTNKTKGQRVKSARTPVVTYSGRFNLRITPELHERLVALAAADGGRSLNSLAAAVLAGWAKNAGL